ncbi:MAG: right-handed parallel beta-helix repeat-containing protein [Phycisphaerales bacterium]|nr:right-handed parallel beta-helix repeat-containing protein [Phycisphaerales bacterium]
MLFCTKSMFGALALGAVLSLGSLSVGQTTYYVNGSCGNDAWTGLSPVCEAPDGPKSTIQAGINAASDLDTVRVADGVYAGEGNKNLTFFQNEVILQSVGGAENCIIDCEGDGRAINLDSGEPQFITIQGFTVRNGMAPGGGGIFIAGVDARVIECVIDNCTSAGSSLGGGGILVNSDSNFVTIARTSFRSNLAYLDIGAGQGGGMTIAGTAIVDIQKCTFSDNGATGLEGRGGALATNGRPEVSVTDCSFTGSSAVGETPGRGFGGAIYNEASLLAFIRCRITSNVATGWNQQGFGGGIYNAGIFSASDCRIEDNEAWDGGGVYGRQCTLTDSSIRDNRAFGTGGGIWTSHCLIERCDIIGNEAAVDGGGIAKSGPIFELRQCNVRHNTAGRDGGGLCEVESYSGMSVWQSLFADNSAGRSGGAICGDSLDFGDVRETTVTHNSAGAEGGGFYLNSQGSGKIYSVLIWGNTPDSLVIAAGDGDPHYCNIEGGWAGRGDFEAPPRFVNPEQGDYRLSAGSPCIDAGDGRNGRGEFDLDGLPRGIDDPGMPDAGTGPLDIGCYEFQGTTDEFVVIRPLPGAAGRPNTVNAAGAQPGHLVRFVYGFRAGLTEIPGCPGVTLDIVEPRFAAQATADVEGRASVTMQVPWRAVAKQIILQAVDLEACEVSSYVWYQFH